MTITLQAVNELIASLESAGELSIREQKFLKLAKAHVQLAAENVALKKSAPAPFSKLMMEALDTYHSKADDVPELAMLSAYVKLRDGLKTPATDRIVAGIKADGRIEGAHFVANRMLAAWDAGFIEDTAKNAADIARMILTSTEFMAAAPEGDFDRSFADGILEDIAQQLREGADK
ncbi:hypothetical protein [Escherichia coli]|uniref:hypothetical protein n=1 Tax=Escherichia coli TaxID=562 RepID=UPI0004D4603A|nr:hypothetical protein [Escherichia coli]EEV6041356.1 hypothetical protein [Escherichia coli]EFD9635140.1 hypothetical protein [Escherichia coli]EGF5317351.1 hypothetical protein [Escherichia coli]EHI0054847.1 hypothetical protein [Escherichia coli]KDW07916.1 hypothetical protein AB60_1330 [Escherichia coli 2-156-04_S1_C3]